MAIAANSSTVFRLTYRELLGRVKGFYEHRIYITQPQPATDYRVTLTPFGDEIIVLAVLWPQLI